MRRSTGVKELLDGDLDARTLRANLRDLARVNRLMGGAELTWRAVKPWLRAGRAVSVLDVGTGSGDIPQHLLRRAGGRGIRVVATEVRPELVDAATRRARTWPSFEVRLQRDANVIDSADAEFDVVHASLVLHHLEPAQAIGLLREMARVSRSAVVINDLDRKRHWWIGAWLMSRLLTANRYTRHDAPLSVRRAYRPEDIVELARQAGLREVARYWARPRYRYAIVFERVTHAG